MPRVASRLEDSLNVMLSSLRLGVFDLGSTTRTVPVPDNIHSTVGMIDTVDDAVGTHHKLPNTRSGKLGNDASQFGKICQTFRATDKEPTKRNGPLR